MIPSPFRFEKNLKVDDYRKLGVLMLRWAHTEHVIGNCLKTMLRLSESEGDVMVFSLMVSERLKRISALRKDCRMNAAAEHAVAELLYAMEHLSPIRNMVAHALLLDDGATQTLQSRKGGRKKMDLAKVFASEELTNYAAHAALVFRHELGEKDPAWHPGPLPKRPPLNRPEKPAGESGVQGAPDIAEAS